MPDSKALTQTTHGVMATFASVSVDEVRPRNNSYFPALDGLRAIAFGMVFMDHYLQMPWGWAGVDVFFVLSGFLITGILFDTREDAHRVRNFYLRRTLRIFPLYYGVIILVALLYPVFHWRWSWHWLIWPFYIANFACIAGDYSKRPSLEVLNDGSLWSMKHPNNGLIFGHFWSLCVEEQFYLIWPWIVFWIKDRKKLLWFCGTFVLMAPLLRIVSGHWMPSYMLAQETLYRVTPFRIDSLLLGGLIALVYRGKSVGTLTLAARVAFVAMSGAFLLWLVLKPGARYGTIHYVYPNWEFTWGLVFIDLFSAAILILSLTPESWTSKVLAFRPLRWLGRISYGAYVFHDIPHLAIMHFVQHHTGHYRLPTAAIALVGTLLIAWASYRWYETPFIRLKDRFTYHG